MTQNENNNRWADEFRSFLEAEEIQPPLETTRAIQQFVHDDLNPKLSAILTKLSLLHVLVGSLSLLLCSQFGMGINLGLAHVFMKWGDLACTAACGSLFLGLTTIIAGLILSKSELRRIRKTAYAPVFLISLVSLIVFLCFGAEIALDYALVWFIGAVFSGIICTEISFGVKRIRFL